VSNYLRVRTQDNAGNWAAWVTLFTLRYDGSPPDNPTSIDPGCAATDGVWQHTCNNPDFTWSGATDGSCKPKTRSPARLRREPGSSPSRLGAPPHPT